MTAKLRRNVVFVCPLCKVCIVMPNEDLDLLTCKICRHLLHDVSVLYRDIDSYPYWLHNIATSFLGDRIDWQVAVLSGAEAVGHKTLHLWLWKLVADLFGDRVGA